MSRGTRLTPAQRDVLRPTLADRYRAGETMTEIAASIDRSYGFVWKLLVEAGVPRRPRGRRLGVPLARDAAV